MKIEDVVQIMKQYSLSALALVETWHDPNTPGLKRLSSFYGYNVIDKPRARTSNRLGCNHGGIVILTTPTTRVEIINLSFSPTTFETISARLYLDKEPPIIFTTIYRTGPLRNLFFDEFNELLSRLILLTGSLLITGDVNIRLERKRDSDTVKFNHLIDCFGLKQHISLPTHNRGGQLDILVSDQKCPVLNIDLCESGLSDHLLVKWSVNRYTPGPSTTTISYRRWSSLDIEEFLSRLSSSELTNISLFEGWEADKIANKFSEIITNILDDILPLQTSTRLQSRTMGCFDSECRELRRQIRRFERQYRRSEIDRTEWTSRLSKYRKTLRSKRRSHWLNQISSENNPGKLWKLVNHIAGRENAPTNPLITPDVFMEYFDNKTSEIRNRPRTTLPEFSTPLSNPCIPLDCFPPTNAQEIFKTIMSLPNKHCPADEIPVWLLKKSLHLLLPFLVLLFNTSYQEGTFPMIYKKAHVTPVLKKDNLDPSDPKSHRPISNLKSLSKAFEKMTLTRLLNHLEPQGLLPSAQSAYRKYHSTETVLARLFSDLTLAMDRSEISLLALLDMTAAFDTVDLNILITRLRSSFAIQGTALQWLTSYITGRTQTVVAAGKSSYTSPLLSGVPQGSVLGPLLFSLYVSDIQSIVEAHSLKCLQYADDIQIYTSGLPQHPDALRARISECVSELSSWMNSNGLSFNPSKSEVIWFVSPRLTNQNLTQLPVFLSNVWIHPSTVVRSLGAMLDSGLSLRPQVSRVVSSCYFVLRSFRSVKKFLPRPILHRLVVCCIFSKLDYCNSILANAPACLLNDLQLVINTSARLVLGLPKFERITETLNHFGWLRIPQRITLKLSTMVYKGLRQQLPLYLVRDLERVSDIPSRERLRSHYSSDLEAPRTKTMTFGDRCFASSSTMAWNTIPESVRTSSSIMIFKNRLRTYLLSLSFPNSPMTTSNGHN